MARPDRLTREELRDLNQCWRGRCERLPARFETFEGYLEAVESGLLEKPPSLPYNCLTEAELVAEIKSAAEVPMPPWRPRPQGPSPQCLASLARMTHDLETDGSDE